MLSILPSHTAWFLLLASHATVGSWSFLLKASIRPGFFKLVVVGGKGAQ